MFKKFNLFFLIFYFSLIFNSSKNLRRLDITYSYLYYFTSDNASDFYAVTLNGITSTKSDEVALLFKGVEYGEEECNVSTISKSGNTKNIMKAFFNGTNSAILLIGSATLLCSKKIKLSGRGAIGVYLYNSTIMMGDVTFETNSKWL